MPCNAEATTQAAAILLGNTQFGTMSHLRLLKLLYLADRRMLELTGTLITYDHAVAMKHGPVLSDTYNMIKGESLSADLWQRHIHKDGVFVTMIDRPGRDQLTRKNISVLNDVQKETSRYNDWELIEWMHETLPEWIDNWKPEEGKVHPIPLEDILSALGIAGEEASQIVNFYRFERSALRAAS